MAGLPAPFADVVAVEVAADAVDAALDAVDAALDADETEAEVPVAVLTPVAERELAVDVAPMGAVDWPSIWAWRVALNDPVIPAKLDGRKAEARVSPERHKKR